MYYGELSCIVYETTMVLNDHLTLFTKALYSILHILL